MSTSETSITIYTERENGALIIGLGLIFSVIGVILIMDGQSLGWLSLITFSPGIPMGVMMVTPRGNKLVINQNGFEEVKLFKRSKYRWDEVSAFVIHTGGDDFGIWVVKYHLLNPRGNHLRRFLRRRLFGSEAYYLSFDYLVPPEDLMTLLNAWRERYLQAVVSKS